MNSRLFGRVVTFNMEIDGMVQTRQGRLIDIVSTDSDINALICSSSGDIYTQSVNDIAITETSKLFEEDA